MARFRKITVQMWLGGSFQRLSPLVPSGQALWVYLLTNPDTVSIPGLYRAGEAQMAEALGWTRKAFREAFREVFREGMAKADWAARVVYVPRAIEYDPPANPNVVKGWGKWFDEIPECPLKVEALKGLREFTEGLGKPFAEAFPKRYRQGLPIQESGVRSQEQDSGIDNGAPKAPKHSPREKTARDLSKALGSSLAPCRKQVAALLESGWPLDDIRSSLSEAVPGMAPWDWTKRITGAENERKDGGLSPTQIARGDAFR